MGVLKPKILAGRDLLVEEARGVISAAVDNYAADGTVLNTERFVMSYNDTPAPLLWTTPAA